MSSPPTDAHGFISNFVLTLLDDPPASNDDQLRAITLLKSESNRTFFATCLDRRCQGKEFEVTGASFEILVALVAAALRESNNDKDFASARMLLRLSELLFSRAPPSCSVEHLKDRPAVKRHEVYRSPAFWSDCFAVSSGGPSGAAAGGAAGGTAAAGGAGGVAVDVLEDLGK